jgi:hypothetical protein
MTWAAALVTIAACALAVFRELRAPSAGVSRSVWWAAGLATCLLLAAATVHRFAGTDRLFFTSDELGCLLPAIRLHWLPWWNLDGHVRYNFFKSAVMTLHGLGDTAFFYGVAGVCRVLRVGITEQHLMWSSAGLSAATLVVLWRFTRRFWGLGAAVAVLGLAAWMDSLITFSQTGFQITFVVFLQAAILWAYAAHASRDRWGSSLVAAALMALCAGSEVFFIAPVLLALHYTVWRVFQGPVGGRPEGWNAYVGWWSRKNLVVWGAYAAVMALNLFLLIAYGTKVWLTMFGHVYRKRMVETVNHPDFGPGVFIGAIDQVLTPVPWGAGLALAAAVTLAFRSRRDLWSRFLLAYYVFVTGASYALKLSWLHNLIHLLIPHVLLVGVAGTQLATWAMARLTRRRWTAEAAGLLLAAGVLTVARPFTVRASTTPVPEPYRCIKAVGFAVRELGGEAMPRSTVFVASRHTMIPTSMEYYLGLNAASDDGEPTALFHAKEGPIEQYLASAVAKRLGRESFDFYVEFARETGADHDALIADLHAGGLAEVARIVEGPEIHARIYARTARPLRTITIAEGNAGFDRRYARWPELFYHRGAGTVWYFGNNY